MSLSQPELRFLIFEALKRSAQGERHGWGVFSTLRDEGGLVPHTTVYRTLEALELEGFVEAREGAPSESYAGTTRRYFKLTLDGRKEMDRLGTLLEVANQRLTQALDRWRGAIAPPPPQPEAQPKKRIAGA
jgi:DNA-binding PadR family transcriptional regulator